LIDSSYGCLITPFSVIIPEINSGGVISKAGLITLIPGPFSLGSIGGIDPIILSGI